jgi:superfamily II DNA or RNA helicase
MPELRDYQRAVIERARQALSCGKRRIVIVAPTGAGKTVLAAAMAVAAAAAAKRVLFLVHRRELVVQASRKLHAAGLDHGIVAAGFPGRPGEPVQVASISTLHARAVRSSSIELPAADIVFVDEAHHATARTWRRLIQAYPDASIVGLTATPCRGDGRGLGAVFEALVECPAIACLTADGYLVPTRVYAPSPPDLAGVRVTAGDYNEKQLAERMDRPRLVGDVVEHWLRLADRRKTVVFAVGVGHAVHLRDAFGRAGVAAAHVDGTTPLAERDAILAGLAAGTVDVVVNCGVLTEGFDLPDIGCIVLARPTKSFGLYRQIVGRGLRPAPGKDHCLVLDHAGCTLEHGFIDEPVQWTLAPDKRALRPAEAARAARRMKSLVECPECSAARWQGQRCRACGWRLQPRPRDVATIAGELGELSRDGTVRPRAASLADNKLSFYRQLLWIARERGYKPGWAAHKYREKFDVWPRRQVAEPEPPAPEVLSWVHSRQVAYARAMEKARLA